MTICYDCGQAPSGARHRVGNDAYAFEPCLECRRLDWVGHPRCDNPGETESFLIKHREDILVLGQIVDEAACYSYDDWALIRVLGEFYLLNTSGCSCPSPSETWSVAIGPATLEEIRDFVVKHVGGVPEYQRDEFLAAIDLAGSDDGDDREISTGALR